MDYLIGLRVIRGKRWVAGKEPRPGSVGTIMNYNKEGSKSYVEVKWDTGTLSTIEHPGSNTVLVLNTASIGMTHFLSCSVCGINPVYGYNWKCMECPDINLCNRCYHAGKHNKKHTFTRYDNDINSTEVGKRHGTKKMKVSGLFKGATVILNDHRGSTRKRDTMGKVETTTTDGIAHVKWKSGRRDTYRFGGEDEEGKMMELLCTKGTSGGSYYTEHMPEPWALDIILEDGYMMVDHIRPKSRPSPEQQPKPRYVETSMAMSSDRTSSDTPDVEGMVKINPNSNGDVQRKVTDDLGIYDNEEDSEDEYLHPYEIKQVVAIMDCLPVSSDEIGFFKGDVIINVTKIDNEWMKGNLNGKIGFFPSDYVKIPGQECGSTARVVRVEKILVK